MSYYTDFTLSIEEGDEVALEHYASILNGDDYPFLEVYARGGLYDTPVEMVAGGNAQWSSYDKDMRELSSNAPGELFTLYGCGEGDEDLWVAYYLDGKGCKSAAMITYEPFDEVKLL